MVQSLRFVRSVRRPVESGIEKRGSRHISQEVCPWNSFAEPTSEEAFLAREGLDGLRLIEWMTMTQEEFSARFRGSPIKRADAGSVSDQIRLKSWRIDGERIPHGRAAESAEKLLFSADSAALP
jgi:hypothetical protein